jgi:hypothetical protein
MKVGLLFFLFFIFSCTTKQTNNKSKSNLALDTIAGKTILADTAYPNTEILETFVDSMNIGEKGKTKIELIKHRVFDDIYVIVKFYTKGPNYWYNQNTYLYDGTGLREFEPTLSDYNNDKYNDLSFISGTAARGANEVRRLFIYEGYKKKLISIANSEEYPNMLYNEELDCIDAFLVHGTSSTEFARIVNDSLKTFASVYNDLDFHTISSVDTRGNRKEIKKVKSRGAYIRFKNFEPLEEYKD